MIPVSNRSLISIEQLEDEIIEERASIIRDWYLRSLITKNDLAVAVNCIKVDCKNPSKCPCENVYDKPVQHFEIPQTMDSLGRDSIIFLGSTDRSVSFKVYYNLESVKYQKYRKRGADKPYAYIERTPNENGMYDGWLFNAPFVKYIAIIGIFKDPRQLATFGCCENSNYLDLGSISSEIIRRILAKKTQLYRTASISATQTT